MFEYPHIRSYKITPYLPPLCKVLKLALVRAVLIVACKSFLYRVYSWKYAYNVEFNNCYNWSKTYNIYNYRSVITLLITNIPLVSISMYAGLIIGIINTRQEGHSDDHTATVLSTLITLVIWWLLTTIKPILQQILWHLYLILMKHSQMCTPARSIHGNSFPLYITSSITK